MSSIQADVALPRDASTSSSSGAQQYDSRPRRSSSSAIHNSTRKQIQAQLSKKHFVVHPSVVSPNIPSIVAVASNDLIESEATTNSKASSSSKPTRFALGFDAVPRNSDFSSLKPILSQLPAEPETTEDEEHESAQSEAAEDRRQDSLDYILKEGVMYTQSRLPTLDDTSRELWKVLHKFRPTRADYAVFYTSPDRQTKPNNGLDSSVPPHPLIGVDPSAKRCPFVSSRSSFATTSSMLQHLRDSFNWAELTLSPSLDSSWYGVLFRSVRRIGSESINFYEADRLAHEEAVRSGGLIMYWYGSPDPATGENLATCIWTSRGDAIQASKLPHHIKATRFAAKSYDRYDLVRYKLVKRMGEPTLRIMDWDE